MEDIKTVARAIAWKVAKKLDPHKYRNHDFAADVAVEVVAELQKDATPVAFDFEYASPAGYHEAAILRGSEQEGRAFLAKMGCEVVSVRPLLHPHPKAATVPQGWKSLTDAQWMNIVNHDHAYENYSKEDAVHEAVKRTEAKLKELNAAPSLPAQSEGEQK